MKVLVSPVSYREAEGIVDTGVDIIDVKNVKEGSLGAQLPWRTLQIVELASAFGIKTSATLGDLPFKPGTAALAAFGAANTGATYIKAGLHGLNTYDQACEMMGAVCEAVRMVSDTAHVVAAGYADWRRFDGLSAWDLVRAARSTGCDAVMVDTAIKAGNALFDNMSFDELQRFVDEGKEAGMVVALAGSLKFEHADTLIELNPSVIGVRGAVCEGKDRKTAICPEKTRRFVERFHSGVENSQQVA